MLQYPGETAGRKSMTELRKLIVSNLPDQRRILEQAISEINNELDPDSGAYYSKLMIQAMDRAEGIYRTEEKKTFDRIVREEYGTSPDKVDSWLVENFDELQNMFMSLFQSRKPRAGKTLHDLMAVVLTKSGIPHKEVKNLFIIDSVTQIACKRTVRERWLQIAPSTGEKHTLYLVTQDEKIAPETIREMGNRKVVPVVPSDIRMLFYNDASKVITLDTLIAKLESIRGESYF